MSCLLKKFVRLGKKCTLEKIMCLFHHQHVLKLTESQLFEKLNNESEIVKKKTYDEY